MLFLCTICFYILSIYGRSQIDNCKKNDNVIFVHYFFLYLSIYGRSQIDFKIVLTSIELVNYDVVKS